MGIADSLAQSTKEKGSPGLCPFARLMERLASEDRVALEKTMVDGILSNQEILRAIRKEGIRVSKDSLSAHRKGTCTCEPGRQPEHRKSERGGA